MKRRLYQLTIIVIGLFIIYGSSRNILELWQQKQRVWRMQKEVKDLEVKEAELKKQLEYYRSDDYVEKMAREKLLLQKEGETTILLPVQQNEIQNSLPADATHQALQAGNLKDQNDKENQQTEQSIWQRLVELFGSY